MARKSDPFERKADGVISPLLSPSSGSFEREPVSSSDGKISPAVLLIIVILAVIFFVCGVLHMVVRFVMKRPSFYSFSRYRRNPDGSGSDALQRQLQELFRLHDSGLDQDIIDALPVFCYRDIVGSKEPFDCAVCLCEFSDQDQLRLLPDCSHAFHVNCIDTWLLSNSTCPLCRGTLMCAGYSFKDQLLGLDYFRELSNSARSTHQKPTIMEEPDAERRVYSVRLGKFQTVNTEGVGRTERDRVEEPSRSNLDARRCYSLGSCQYVIDDSDLLVSLSDSSESETRGQIGSSLVDVDVEAMRISSSTKGESFSISKIWQWSKKGKFPTSSDANASNGSPSVG